MSSNDDPTDQGWRLNQGFEPETSPSGDTASTNTSASMVKNRQPIDDPELSGDLLVPKTKYGGPNIAFEDSDASLNNNSTISMNNTSNKLAGKFRGFNEQEGEPLPRFSCFRYPIAVYFMLGNEFCERFSYYGMRAVLTLYFVLGHGYSENTAKMLFHSFVMVCYATPIFGSILADGYVGRFKVILIGSIVYVAGHVFLSLGALPQLGDFGTFMDFLGLFVIAFATGGIKPCVAAFAADQFGKNQKRLQGQFFAFFYFSINVGALLSKIVTPIFRSQPCMGKETCFPLAFGIPSILMLVALIIFIIGKPFYTNVGKTDGFVLGTVGKILCFGFKHLGSRKEKGVHWLDGAKNHFDPILVENVKGFQKITILFMPLCLFWALFDQQGSTWVLMARRMNGRIGNFTILPDQMSVSNPVLVIIMVPIFQTFIYPLLTKFRILTTPLQRMTAGGILAMISFIIAGLIQLFMIDATMVVLPPAGTSRVFISNQLKCTVEMIGMPAPKSIESGSQLQVNFNEKLGKSVTFKTGAGCIRSYTFDTNNFTDKFKVDRKTAYTISLFEPESTSTDSVQISFKSVELEKAENGKTELLVFVRNIATGPNANTSFYIENEKGAIKTVGFANSVEGSTISIKNSGSGSNRYRLVIEGNAGKVVLNDSFESHMGEIVGLVLDPESTIAPNRVNYVMLVPPNTVNILWQLPQYVIITSGEILISITGLEFSYSQAAPSMKSVLQATWLLTTFAGNLIDLIISGARIVENAGHEFFIYAGLMGLVMLVFMVLAHFYEYIQPDDPRLARAEDLSPLDTKSREEFDFQKYSTPSVAAVTAT